jgi:hypothetical protein
VRRTAVGSAPALVVTTLVLVAVTSFPLAAYAQGGPGGGGGQAGPTKSSPTQIRTVGPRSGPGDDDEPRAQVSQRPSEPSALAPADPLAMSPATAARIGTDSDLRPPAPVGETQRRFFPWYEERKGDYRFRFLPPLYLEHTRGLPDPSRTAGEPTTQDRESLYGLLYYQRRSLKLDADILFPLAWRVRDRDNHVLVLGPLAHREAPKEHDNWLAPLVFEGKREHGGYFHSLPLLTSSHWSSEGAFTLVGPYFRDRTGADVDWGVAPFVFHGDNGNIEGARRTYTLIPPLLYFHKEAELEESKTTVVGPLILRSTPKRSIFDIAPFFYHIKGKPETGGVNEEHTTLFPFFHYGHKEDESLFVVPGYFRRVTATVDTMITPLLTLSSTRNNSTHLTAVGPILPLFWTYRDKDIGLKSFGILPFYYQSDSPAGHDFLTPLFGKFETYGVSRTWWAFPTITVSTDTHGWSTNLHPLIYVGRSDQSSHTVLAPIFWDFANKNGRATVGFPLYWRFSDNSDDSVFQLAANTLYMQKRVAGGLDWQFHILPLLSYGANPQGHWWNVLFGLAGYERSGSYARAKAFWVPFQVAGP